VIFFASAVKVTPFRTVRSPYRFTMSRTMIISAPN